MLQEVERVEAASEGEQCIGKKTACVGVSRWTDVQHDVAELV